MSVRESWYQMRELKAVRGHTVLGACHDGRGRDGLVTEAADGSQVVVWLDGFELRRASGLTGNMDEARL